MSSRVTAINLGGVNCYLLTSDQGFVLIDTGFQTQRKKLEQKLEEAGCKPGNLKLILLTHGDTDHVGNGAYLHEKYGAPTAIHSEDAVIVETGDMGRSRKPTHDKLSFIFRVMMVFTKRMAERHPLEKFTPDLMVDEDFDLAKYGLHARVVHIPGHSKGSIGVLTESGDLLCGDMFYNMPGFSFIDDMQDHLASVKKLEGLTINTVYPGHGKPFTMASALRR